MGKKLPGVKKTSVDTKSTTKPIKVNVQPPSVDILIESSGGAPTTDPDISPSAKIPKVPSNQEVTKEFTVIHHSTPSLLSSVEQQAYFSICKTASKSVDIYKTNRFFLQNISKPLMERFQITEIFSPENKYQEAPAISFFGSRTRIYTMVGIVYSALAEKYLWDDQLRRFYDEYFRVTKLIETDCIGKLSFSGNIWYGYPSSLSFVDDASNPNLKQFTMQWIIADEYMHAFPEIAFKDPRVAVPKEMILRLKIKSLESELIVLDNEIASLEQLFLSESLKLTDENKVALEKTLKEKRNLRKTKQAEYDTEASKVTWN